jgi:hypothetical protein
MRKAANEKPDQNVTRAVYASLLERALQKLRTEITPAPGI